MTDCCASISIWSSAFIPSLSLSTDFGPWLQAIRESWATAFDLFWRLVEFLIEHSPKLFGAAGFAFGVYKWWYTRESALHKRLQQYIVEQDRRLEHARADVLDAIHRPGPKREFADPLFAVKSLRNILRQRRWHSPFDFGRIETSAERSLDKALIEIEHRLEIAVAALTSLRSQMAGAHMLKGAIAAVQASRREGSRQIDLDDRALIQFRTVLQVHDYERDVQAKEYEAHQLRRLGHLTESALAYEQLEGFTAWIADERLRYLMLARARRHRAQIAQAQHIFDYTRGLRDTTICPAAHRLMMNDILGAIALRAPFAPFRDWEAIEQGENHYVAAFVCCHYGAKQQEGTQLSLAESAYKGVLSQHPGRWFMPTYQKRLRAVAEAGLARIEQAQNKSEYDAAWLLPLSHQPQSTTASVGDGGSD